MLAERRKKVIYSNPGGTLWANDKQKLGQKILESMGWREGKGLGKDQKGITENIKAYYKFDNKGLGYKSRINDWIEDNNVYEKILSDLSKCHNVHDLNGKPELRSNIELKIQSRNKLYYKKFINAKNLSIKSKEDLCCIFPTKQIGKHIEVTETKKRMILKTKK